MKTSYARIDDPEQVLKHIANTAPRTVIFDVEPLVAFWDTDTATLDRGIVSVLERLGDVTGVEVIAFATNSARRQTRTPNGQAQRQVLYLASAGKPLRTKPYRSLPRPDLVVGDQVPTDGLLARRLGYGFVHYQPRLPGTPRSPRAMRMLGQPLRPILFTR
jgi:predicted HAD superfamily phosphohydrolase YqeG